jgi:chromosome segregation ATPase
MHSELLAGRPVDVTQIMCISCEHGVEPKHAVNGLCPDCAEKKIAGLEKLLSDTRTELADCQAVAAWEVWPCKCDAFADTEADLEKAIAERDTARATAGQFHDRLNEALAAERQKNARLEGLLSDVRAELNDSQECVASTVREQELHEALALCRALLRKARRELKKTQDNLHEEDRRLQATLTKLGEVLLRHSRCECDDGGCDCG